MKSIALFLLRRLWKIEAVVHHRDLAAVDSEMPRSHEPGDTHYNIGKRPDLQLCQPTDKPLGLKRVLMIDDPSTSYPASRSEKEERLLVVQDNAFDALPPDEPRDPPSRANGA